MISKLNMETSEEEESFKSLGQPQLYGEMCKSLFAVYTKVYKIFPDIEAARPRSTSGIQAICSLHLSLEKIKCILQHCAECSKLYLAITGDSVVQKFIKAQSALKDSLRRMEDIVPQRIGGQVAEMILDLERVKLSVNDTEKQIGDNIIILLQMSRNFNSESVNSRELELFRQVASKLGITSSMAARKERRCLKKIIEKARAKNNIHKESIIACLLHLMSQYSSNDLSDSNDSPVSIASSPDLQVSLDRKLSKASSFNFKMSSKRFEQMYVPPGELRCPISLKLMYDPVILASGQTYERVCIEKWFEDGHKTCPKTRQPLPHLSLIPNYCVKGLVASWCEQNEIPVPDGPPKSLDINYWRLVLLESDSTDPKPLESADSRKFENINVQPDNCSVIEKAEENEVKTVATLGDKDEEDSSDRYERLLSILNEEDDLMKKCEVVEQIRHRLKDDEEARIYMGAHGFVEALMLFLESAISSEAVKCQEIGAMALFNLAVNNNRNKQQMLASGVLALLQKMIVNTESVGAAAALYVNLSCLDEAKPVIGTSESIPFLVGVVKRENDMHMQCKLDALHTLYNVSSHPSNIPHLLSSGIIDALQELVSHPGDHTWNERCIALLNFLASDRTARDQIIAAPGLVNGLAAVLDVGKPIEQEQAAACLLVLCTANENCSRIVLEEGVIPSLVSISVNGTARGKQKAQKLLMLFREHRQLEEHEAPVATPQRVESSKMASSPVAADSKPLSKSISRRKVGKAINSWWKNKSFSVHQY